MDGLDAAADSLSTYLPRYLRYPDDDRLLVIGNKYRAAEGRYPDGLFGPNRKEACMEDTCWCHNVFTVDGACSAQNEYRSCSASGETVTSMVGATKVTLGQVRGTPTGIPGDSRKEGWEYRRRTDVLGAV